VITFKNYNKVSYMKEILSRLDHKDYINFHPVYLSIRAKIAVSMCASSNAKTVLQRHIHGTFLYDL
jgi:hypothetical protein